jgi:hypothetical protein
VEENLNNSSRLSNLKSNESSFENIYSNLTNLYEPLN